MVPNRLLGGLPAMLVERAARPFRGVGNVGNPWRTSLNCTSRGGIVRWRLTMLPMRRGLARTQSEADIGGQPLEQCAGVPRFRLLLFLRAQ